MTTITDLFCGAGGSSLGAEKAGGQLVLGLNHWARAIETHSTNFPDADHDCADVSSLTTSQIRRYPDSDILLASPECTNHSLAKGARRRKPQGSSLFDDGPAGDDEQDRSRATMWDVPRFAEQKILKGQPYKAIVVENVPDAFKWGYDDDGGLFQAWLQAMRALGYEHSIVWLNSMFAPPTPQSRDRMYVVFWRRGIRKPNLRVEPPAWCPRCSEVVAGRQSFKRPNAAWGRYGIQYVYSCPRCGGTAIPGAYPAASAIDWTVPATRIGDRTKALAPATMERIRRGLERLSREPFAIRLLQGGIARPTTLPFVTLTGRQDMGMVIPVAGTTYETTPGNRARDAATQPMSTINGTLDRALVLSGTQNDAARDALREPSQVQTTTRAPDAHADPVGTVRTNSRGGGVHALIMRNNTPRGDAGQMSTPDHEPFRTLTGACHQSLVVPYYGNGTARATGWPSPTLTPKDRLGLCVPPNIDQLPEVEPVEWTDDAIDDCRFRMFELDEIARTMVMADHVDGGEYVVHGNKRERMMQYGNAVTPPVMELLVSRLLEVL